MYGKTKINNNNKKKYVSKEYLSYVESEYSNWVKKKNTELAERKYRNEVYKNTKQRCSLLLQIFNAEAYEAWLKNKQRNPSEDEPLPAMRIWKPLKLNFKPSARVNKPWIPPGPSTFSNQEITNNEYVNYDD